PMSNPTRYPLCWPAGWPRTAPPSREFGRFGRRDTQRAYAVLRELTIAQATQRVLDELGRMGVSCQDVVVSTDVELRADGLPRSARPHPSDPGVAVYWTTRKDGQRCMAIDRYRRVADNLAAVAATLEAMRAIE